ncbi:transglycosylase SLT domain-containing protein [Hafnia paralvei]|uniref:Transglycosylase SLT domain protein n=1 Tax=Hafnia phage yong1 TaxID=2719181 RepID=A0A7D2HHW0_9CAUD|nr:transglycosylase SLT domain-containing protein [Hafnia paralvei]YP_010738139.1 transglycosylase SLT domain protein [Hafnia phage yong1]MBW2956161.1 transglycosylase SLT domain-containing protein [Hafnia paralvei]MBW2956977.1 transglycosylase SLT domain-containing protein [Hafnia paralvei]QIQ67963.1 transglycosylase SLT domain protein [Hafnia phage yong1]
MSADTIKDFLVSLGFDIDEAGANKFEAVLKGVTANVLKLGTVVEGAALSIYGFTTQIANGLDNLYWASQRTGASVAGIKALGYAASQTGGSAEAAKSSLESLSRFMRNNPGAEGFLNRLGIQTRDAQGNMRDTAAVFTSVGQQLSKMPYYRANQYAQMLGIDENTLMAMRRGLGSFNADYQSMLQKTGFNAERAAEQSNQFMTSMRGLTGLFGILRDKIGSNLAGGLSGDIDNLRKNLLDNFPKIEGTLTKTIKGILWLADAFGRMAYRVIQGAGEVIEWWKKLDAGSKQFLEILGALLIAWRLLNSAFLMSPIGMITSLVVGLGLLYDDYKTWKEGGKSLIDWGQWESEIGSALKGLTDLKDSIKGVGIEIAKLLNINLKNWTLKGDIEDLTKQFGEFGKMMTMIGDLLNAIKEGNWKEAYAIGKQLMSQGQDQPDALSPVTDSANSAADWFQSKTGLDPRSIGRWMRGENEPEQRAQSARRQHSSPLLDKMGGMFAGLEKLYNLPMGLLRGVAQTESAGNPNAVSRVGAKGLFQFMDGTARDMGLSGADVFNPMKAAEAAAKYLSQLLKANGGDLDKALASYNWGIGNVQKHGLALMPKETRNYIPRVKSNMVSASTPSIEQKNTYHIYGGNAAEIGGEVERRQVNANAQVLRRNQVSNS